jgi:hypothetical protein
VDILEVGDKVRVQFKKQGEEYSIHRLEEGESGK